MEKIKKLNEAINVLWAKSSPFVSIRTHSICAGICAKAFLESFSSQKTTLFLSNCFSISSNELINLVSYLSSVHDIGKIHPAFQKSDPANWEYISTSFPDAITGTEYSSSISSFRHEYYSDTVLHRIWSDKGVDEECADLFGRVISLHHQKRSNNIEKRAWIGNSVWEDWQNNLESEMTSLFLKNSVLKVPREVDAACILVSSIIVLSDWVSSSELFTNVENMSLDEIYKNAEYAEKLYGIISDSLFPEIKDFSEMFPSIKNPNPLQIACQDISNRAKLTIIEAPMGEGKTEAGLYIATQLCKTYKARGVYMALPSQATSNQMHKRVKDILSSLSYDTARLLHGAAFLMEENYVPWSFNITPDMEEPRYEDRVAAAKWSRPTRMGLLGANAVGTVDQVMASVLLSKFSMIRFAGLANKVLIIDEVHAYDTYMSKIIETMLQWCNALEIPVVLLSATLQIDQKQKYINCFGKKSGEAVLTGYPLITQVLNDGTVTGINVEASSRRFYNFVPQKLNHSAGDLANMALNAVQNGGCIAVMVNTVAYAQEIYRELKARQGSDTRLLLFHSRYPLKRRMEIEKECVALFGKDRSIRPEKAILVATQVVEQSIDLDFDGMISEIAPIDLLLQRAGRLHRHSGYTRPSGMKEPTVRVIIENNSQNLEYKYGKTGFVYDPFLLINTEKIIGSGITVRIPVDMRSVIETVYKDVNEQNKESWEKRIFNGELQESLARNNTWPPPKKDRFFPLETATDILYVFDTDDGYDSTSEASTRIDDGSIRIAFCNEKLFDEIKAHGIRKQEDVEDIYLHSVSIRVKEKELVESDTALKIKNGKLSGIWVFRGENCAKLRSINIWNDYELGVTEDPR